MKQLKNEQKSKSNVFSPETVKDEHFPETTANTCKDQSSPGDSKIEVTCFTESLSKNCPEEECEYEIERANYNFIVLRKVKNNKVYLLVYIFY
jgi:hypothetical protein